MKRIQTAWHVGRFWAESIVMYRHAWRPRPKGVPHKMKFAEGQSMRCACGRHYRRRYL